MPMIQMPWGVMPYNPPQPGQMPMAHPAPPAASMMNPTGTGAPGIMPNGPRQLPMMGHPQLSPQQAALAQQLGPQQLPGGPRPGGFGPMPGGGPRPMPGPPPQSTMPMARPAPAAGQAVTRQPGPMLPGMGAWMGFR